MKDPLKRPLKPPGPGLGQGFDQGAATRLDEIRPDPEPERSTVVILGGGITGLTAGWKLAEKTPFRVILVERSPESGGLASSTKVNGRVVDCGSHRIHDAYDPEVMGILEDLLGKDLLTRPRRGQIRIQGRFLDYPPSMLQILAAFGFGAGLAFARDYALAAVRRLFFKPDPQSFEQYAVAHVGRALYEKFYQPYARKLWNVDPRELAIDPAVNRMRKFEFGAFFREVRKRISNAESLHTYVYPKEGFGQITEAIRERFLAAGGEIRTMSEVDQLEFGEQGQIENVIVRGPDGLARLRADQLVATIPLDTLSGLLDRSLGHVSPGHGLTWRSLRIQYVVTKDKVETPHETYYFPEPDVPFGRVSEIGLYSPYLKPQDTSTVLAIEYACTEGDSIWCADEMALLQTTTTALRKIGILAGAQDPLEMEVWSRKVKNLYPIQLRGWRERFGDVYDRFQKVPNLYVIGRPGLFLHCNADHCMRMALDLSEFLSGEAASERRSAWFAKASEYLEFGIRD